MRKGRRSVGERPAATPAQWITSASRKSPRSSRQAAERDEATAAYVAALVEQAPPLTPDQMNRLRILLSGPATATKAGSRA